MKLYTDEGYLNVPALMDCPETYEYITGARGIGKTFGVLDYCTQNKIPFIMMRRTLAEAQFLARDASTNPFNAINRIRGTEYHIEKGSQYIWKIVDGECNQVGILLALSTVANMRGFSAEWCEVLFYDEFIPELHVRPIKDEHLAFLNAIETIARNRELQGAKPMKVICCSNSNRLDNPLYVGLKLVTKVVKMQADGLEVMHLSKRHILLVNPMHCPVSDAKASTTLYEMCEGTGFSDMALKNKYIGESDTNPLIKHFPLSELRPVVAIGEICIYRHKSNDKWYVCEHMSGTPLVLTMSDNDKARFRKLYPQMWSGYLLNKVFFESRICEILFCKAFD